MSKNELRINGIEYVDLITYADAHELDVKPLRRYVRKSKTTDARKWGSMWLIKRDATIVIPDAKSRGKSRADGRQRFVVYVAPNTDELDRIAAVVGIANVLDPRERARERRANANASE